MFETRFSSFTHSACDGATESREQMDVVCHAADEDQWAIEVFGNATEIRVERIACSFVAQDRAAVFGGKDEHKGEGVAR